MNKIRKAMTDPRIEGYIQNIKNVFESEYIENMHNTKHFTMFRFYKRGILSICVDNVLMMAEEALEKSPEDGDYAFITATTGDNNNIFKAITPFANFNIVGTITLRMVAKDGEWRKVGLSFDYDMIEAERVSYSWYKEIRSKLR